MMMILWNARVDKGQQSTRRIRIPASLLPLITVVCRPPGN